MPYREDADTNRPLSPYAASKKAAETLAFTYHHLHGIDVSIPRYFTVYGPAGRPDMSVFRFIRRIAEGEPIVVFGDGSQSRDFTFVDDIAAGTVAALRPLGYEVINLGGDRVVLLSAIIEQIAELTGQEAADRVSPGPSGRRAHHAGPTSRRPPGCSTGGPQVADRRGPAPLRRVVSRQPRDGPIAGTLRPEGMSMPILKEEPSMLSRDAAGRGAVGGGRPPVAGPLHQGPAGEVAGAGTAEVPHPFLSAAGQEDQRLARPKADLADAAVRRIRVSLRFRRGAGADADHQPHFPHPRRWKTPTNWCSICVSSASSSPRTPR